VHCRKAIGKMKPPAGRLQDKKRCPTGSESINSVHPEMAIFTDFGVGLKF